MSKAKCDEQIYETIVNHWIEFTLPPTIQYIVDRCCLQSKSNVWLALVRLEKEGRIRTVKGKAIPSNMFVDF